uniref:Protein export membrane protein SecD/SecF C-terminal domain-containing protein n=1 Tax=Desulfobacca acetoxidans TaxID=60893 RepID=A0A7V4LDD1_9BACT
MPQEKKVKNFMIPLEDYPHIPYWFTLRQAMAIVREAAIKFEGSFEPRAVLVFDEKYQLMGMLTLRDIINLSVNEVLSRTIVTSVTVFLVVVALYFFGGVVLEDFALAMILGVMVGTYSSVFVASPIIFAWRKEVKRVQIQREKVIELEAQKQKRQERRAAAAAKKKGGKK